MGQAKKTAIKTKIALMFGMALIKNEAAPLRRVKVAIKKHIAAANRSPMFKIFFSLRSGKKKWSISNLIFYDFSFVVPNSFYKH